MLDNPDNKPISNLQENDFIVKLLRQFETALERNYSVKYGRTLLGILVIDAEEPVPYELE
jgi:hypothetical protein